MHGFSQASCHNSKQGCQLHLQILGHLQLTHDPGTASQVCWQLLSGHCFGAPVSSLGSLSGHPGTVASCD